ncbi:MAG: BatA and WFA domain-containing protein [Pirellulales bacterium]
MPELTSMLAPWQWAVLAAVPPAIVALYFLKLKREPLEVPSTYLWSKSIEDLHVNSLWQRLRRSLLLLLQLLLLALLAVALWDPSWRGSQFPQHRYVFLVDHSASMNAVDTGQPDRTRLDVAKQRVAEMIDSMDSRDVGMIVSFSDTAQVVQEPTNNHNLLKRRLATIEPTNRPTRLDDALRVAGGLVNPEGATADAKPAELVVFSDFRLPSVRDFNLGRLTPRFEMVGDPEAGNVGVVAFAARRLDERPDDVQAFARVANFTSQPRRVQVALHLDDALHDVKEIAIDAGDDQGVGFTLRGLESGVLRLEIDGDDSLALDNRAWVVVDRPRRARTLLVTPGNVNLRRALSTARVNELAEVEFAAPDVFAAEEYQRKAQQGWYDLVIYDQCAPPQMPASNTLFIGQFPSDGRWQYGDDIELPQIIDTERTHPLMQLLELGDVAISQARQLKPPLGATTLIDSHEGPIFAIAPRGGYEDAVFGMEFVGVDDAGRRTYNTNWPLRPSFPVFIHETLTYLAGSRAETAADNVQPGAAHVVRAIAAPETLTVVLPDSARRQVAPSRENEFSITATDQLGVYQVFEQDRLTQRFAVNLFDATESDIAPVPGESVLVGDTAVAVRQSPEWQFVRHQAWKPLLLLALVILLFEWYIYNRRVYL